MAEGLISRGRAGARAVRSKIASNGKPDLSSGIAPTVDPHFTLDFGAIGRAGACFLTAPSQSFVLRNVETIEIKSATFARRRLTIDLQLPTDPEIGERSRDGRRVYWVPITSMAKRPPRSNIDLRDEGDKVVPLLTSEENAAISVAALTVAAERVLGKKPKPLLRDLLRSAVVEGGLRGDVPYVMARVGLMDAGADLTSERGAALAETLRVLAGNSLIWVAVDALPGARRVFKFRYDIELLRQKLRREKPAMLRYLVYGHESKSVFRLELPVTGDRNPYTPPRRLAARVALAVGLGAIDFGIDSPYLTASAAYHLQVASPPGVETRDPSVLAKIPGAHVESARQSHGVHVYVTGARIDVNTASLDDGNAPLVNIPLRAGRRGFMTLAWISSLFTAALLWTTAIANNVESTEATGALLLFLPALLSAIVVRPGEHPVANKLLSGIRVLVALGGLLAVAGAANVAGIRPTAINRDHLWTVYAVAASAIAVLVTVSWFFSWDSAYNLATYLRRTWLDERVYRRTCLGLVAAGAAILTLGSGLFGVQPAIDPWIYCGAVAALLAPASFTALSFARLALPGSAELAWYALCALEVYAALASMILAAHLLFGWAWQTSWRVFAVLALLDLVLLVAQELHFALGAKPSVRPGREDAGGGR